MAIRPPKIGTRKAIIASAILLSVGVGGIAATGAWFTSYQTLASNQVKTATVSLGAVGGNALAVTNLVPIVDSDIATKAQTFNVNVVNNGSIAVDWAADIILPTNAPDTTNRVLVAYSVDGGTTWSATTSATAPTMATLATNPGLITGTGLAAGKTQTVMFRAWLPAATSGNSDQGQTITFDLRARAIQSGAGNTALNNNANYPTPSATPAP